MEGEEFDAVISDLEVRLERLRSLYEQYFLGIERIEPSVARKDVDRRFWQLKKIKVRNTARRFKLQTLVQRYNTLQQYWMKVCRQIENGTYVRHLARAKRRFDGDDRRPARLPPHETPPGIGSEPPAGLADDPTPDEVRRAFSALASAEPTRVAPVLSVPIPPPRKPSVAKSGQKSGHPPPPRPSAGASQVTDETVQRLHRELTERQSRLREPSPAISPQELARSLRATEARLRAKHAGKRVEFRVDEKDGRVIIKPTVRR